MWTIIQFLPVFQSMPRKFRRSCRRCRFHWLRGRIIDRGILRQIARQFPRAGKTCALFFRASRPDSVRGSRVFCSRRLKRKMCVLGKIGDRFWNCQLTETNSLPDFFLAYAPDFNFHPPTCFWIHLKQP